MDSVHSAAHLCRPILFVTALTTGGALSCHHEAYRPLANPFCTGSDPPIHLQAENTLPVQAANDGQQPETPSASPPGAAHETVVRRAMGTEFRITLYTRPGDDGTGTVRMIAEEALDAIEDLESRLSRWLPDSHTSYINAHAGKQPVRAAGDVLALIQFAKEIYDETEGAFDITVGPLIRLWDVCRKEGRLPLPSELEDARSKVGLDKVVVDRAAATVSFTQEGVMLDFGGIGKGLALDVAAEVLKQYGIKRALLDGGTSSFVAIGAPPGRPGWTVHMRHPYDIDKNIAEFTICDESFSVSGRGDRAFELNGKTYGHILDPRTGWPVQGILNAGAFAPTGALSDALSTAFFVLGSEKTRQYCVKHPELRAMLVVLSEKGEPRVQCISFPKGKEVL